MINWIKRCMTRGNKSYKFNNLNDNVIDWMKNTNVMICLIEWNNIWEMFDWMKQYMRNVWLNETIYEKCLIEWNNIWEMFDWMKQYMNTFCPFYFHKLKILRYNFHNIKFQGHNFWRFLFHDSWYENAQCNKHISWLQLLKHIFPLFWCKNIWYNTKVLWSYMLFSW